MNYQQYKIPVLAYSLLILLAFSLHLNQLWETGNRTLFLGDRGSDVKKIQQRLTEIHLYKGSVNSYYGIKTFKAIKEFQRKKGLRITGTVNQETWQEIYKIALKKEPSLNDIKLLAHLVEGEAADEPYIGKVAVAAVILNRIKSPEFPDTLAGVIYQPGAFESVNNGQINRPVSPAALKAARAAFNGVDPTGGAVYFWNPAKPVNPWIWQKTIVTTIGRHVFAI